MRAAARVISRRAALLHPFQPRTLVGERYRIRGELTKGAVGVIFVAADTKRQGEVVALKSLRTKHLHKPNILARFGRESLVLRSIEHANILSYKDHGFDTRLSAPFLVTEFIAGHPGKELIDRDPPLALRQIAIVLRQVCVAVWHLHKRGIIHRDLKWSNVMTTDKSRDRFPIKLIDFGILKYAGPAEVLDRRKLTDLGTVIGTPEYSSPEQLSGAEIDERADVYSLGVMTYEILTGRRPFVADSPIDFVLKHLKEVPMPPQEVVGKRQVSAEMSDVVMRALEKAPAKRYQTVVELWTALEAAFDASPG